MYVNENQGGVPNSVRISGTTRPPTLTVIKEFKVCYTEKILVIGLNPENFDFWGGWLPWQRLLV